MNHFIDECVDEVNPCRFLKFMLVDNVNNTSNLSPKEIESLILEKDFFWIGTLILQHIIRVLMVPMIGVEIRDVKKFKAN